METKIKELLGRYVESEKKCNEVFKQYGVDSLSYNIVATRVNTLYEALLVLGFTKRELASYLADNI